MKHASLLAIVAVMMLGVGAVLVRAQDGVAEQETQLPTREYVIEIDGQRHDLNIDDPLNIRIGDNTHRVTLRVKPFVMFQWRGIAFDFPQQYTYSLDDADPTFSQWDISGVSATIMLQCFDDGTSLELIEAVLIPGVKAQFQGLRVEEDQVELTVDSGRRFDGTQLTIKMPDVAIVQRIFMFEHRGKVFALWLQDTLTEQGGPSEEYQAMLKQFKKTFVIED